MSVIHELPASYVQEQDWPSRSAPLARCTERKWLQSEELLSLDLFSDLVKSGSSMGRDQFFTSFHKSKKVENVVIIR